VQGREIKMIFRAGCSGSTEHLICTPPLAWHRPAAAVQAARRAFSPAFSITQRDVVPSAEPDADRNSCAV
jgi:hypothetical protein